MEIEIGEIVLEEEIQISEIVLEEEIEIEDIEFGVEKVYPPLENIVITPKREKQIFKHPNSYGYDEVVVEEIESKELRITPSLEEQVNEGMFHKVITKAIDCEELTVIPSEEEQSFKGIYNEVNIKEIPKQYIIPEGEMDITENGTYDITEKSSANVNVVPPLDNLLVIPSKEEQYFKSANYGYDEVAVLAVTHTIDDNIKPANIKQGVNILGIEGDIIEYQDEEKTVIPQMYAQTILPSDNKHKLSKVIVMGDEDLKPENIKKGVNIFGVEGNATGGTDIKIKDARYLFYQGARLELLNELLDLCENVTSTAYMFYACSNLYNIDLRNFNMSNVTTMGYMFSSCLNLTDLKINGLQTSKVTNFSYCFSGCKKLIQLPEMDFTKALVLSNCFNNCSALTDLGGFLNLGKAYTSKTSNYTNYALNLSTCTELTHDSLMNVINNLYDLNLTYKTASGGTLYTQKLQLGSTNLAKLTAEEIAIATSKRVVSFIEGGK